MGVDVIRDSDGIILSDEILNEGYGIFSTICIIRDHNAWAKQNLDKLQQSFLMTDPLVATGTTLEISLLKDFFAEQFSVNETPASLKNITPFHKYTVNFLCYRIWEEISMYNHATNHWDKEHLIQIDPIHPETQEYMLTWMENWCQTHPDTTVVRFTSM